MTFIPKNSTTLEDCVRNYKMKEETVILENGMVTGFEVTTKERINSIDRKIDEIKELQEELNRRTLVEKEAEDLIASGKPLEAIKLLNTLDDDKLKALSAAAE